MISSVGPSDEVVLGCFIYCIIFLAWGVGEEDICVSWGKAGQFSNMFLKYVFETIFLVCVCGVMF